MKKLILSFRLQFLLLFTFFLMTETVNSQNLIVNGDFSAGNTGFITTNVYCNTSTCLNNVPVNGYAIGPNPQFFHSLFVGSDHTTGTGNMMIVNGSLFADIVWGQNVPVTSNKSYSFSAWASSIYPQNTAVLGYSINGVSQGSVAAPTALNTWTVFSAVWNSGSATTASIVIRGLNTSQSAGQSGVDFGLDDLKLSEIVTTSNLSNERIGSGIKVFPNPTTEILHIETDAPCKVFLHDATGREIAEKDFSTRGELLMTEQSAGIYFLKITKDKSTTVLKIVKTE